MQKGQIWLAVCHQSCLFCYQCKRKLSIHSKKTQKPVIAKCHSKPGTPCFLYPLRFIVDTLAHFLSNTAKNTDKILKRNCCVAFSSSGVEQILPHHYTENWLGRQSPFWAAGTRRLVGDKGNSDGGGVTNSQQRSKKCSTTQKRRQCWSNKKKKISQHSWVV